MSIEVPSSVMVGESFWLNCTLDLESDDLYSVKWYKNEAEFYRHLPSDTPSGQKFDIPGIHLDVRNDFIYFLHIHRWITYFYMTFLSFCCIIRNFFNHTYV